MARAHSSSIPDSPYVAAKRAHKYKRLNFSPQQIEEKEKQRCIKLVLIGNFLEYYDIMLFIHLTFLLNPMFLPKDDPFVENIGKVFMFCSAYLMRPFGAIFWGWIGDRYGRIAVLNSTLTLMGIASMSITTIPPYAEWGWWSAVLVIFCRFMQGFAAGGEVQAATIYLAELSKGKEAYYRDGLVYASIELGRLASGALTTVCLFFFPVYGWKIAFWFGSILAIAGIWGRQALRETPDFIKALQKNKYNKLVEKIRKTHTKDNKESLLTIKATLVALHSLPAIIMVVSFGYAPEQLSKMGVNPATITAQSTIIAGLFAFFNFLSGYVVFKTNKPFSFFKIKAAALMALYILFAVFPVSNSFLFILLLQITGCLGIGGPLPLTPLFIKSIPIFNRCRIIMTTWAITKAVMYCITTSLIVWLGQYYGEKSIVWASVVFSAVYVWGAFRSEALLRPVFNQLNEHKEEKEILDNFAVVR